MPAIRFMLKTSGYRRIWQGFGQIPVSGPLHSTVSYGDPSVAPRLAMICVQESPLKTTPTSNSGSRLVQYKMSLKGGVIPTQDEPGGNLGKVD